MHNNFVCILESKVIKFKLQKKCALCDVIFCTIKSQVIMSNLIDLFFKVLSSYTVQKEH